MSSAEILAEANISSSNGLFSKFTRSPSRKHRPRPSSDSIDVTSAATIKASKSRARPPAHRGTTAPDGAITINTTREGNDGLTRQISNGVMSNNERSNTMFANVPLTTTTSGPESQYNYVRSDVPKMPPINGGLVYNPAVAVASSNPNTLYQHIHDMSSKRIATLDYMRKAHEGRTFWFNTIRFSHNDIGKMPSYTPSRLSRRATNYLILGMSVPAVLDMYPAPPPSKAGSSAAMMQDYLRSLNALLTEFDSYQQLHPADGSSASSLSRARIPNMFKRSSTRPRKSSGVISNEMSQSISAPAMPESGSAHAPQSSFDGNNGSSSFLGSSFTSHSGAAPGATSFPTTSFPVPGPSDAPNSTLLPNEGSYTHLVTPPLPFAPDFYTVFATLCEVLIDVYQRLLHMLSGPDSCTAATSEMFTKCDARIRKIMVGGILREFEGASRDNAKRELMGVQKVVLGGLVGS